MCHVCIHNGGVELSIQSLQQRRRIELGKYFVRYYDLVCIYVRKYKIRTVYTAVVVPLQCLLSSAGYPLYIGPTAVVNSLGTWHRGDSRVWRCGSVRRD